MGRMQVGLALISVLASKLVNSALECKEKLYSHSNTSPQSFKQSFLAGSGGREDLDAWKQAVKENLAENFKIPPVKCSAAGSNETSVLRVAMIHMSMLRKAAEEVKLPEGVIKKQTSEMILEGLKTDIKQIDAHVIAFLDFPITQEHSLTESFREGLKTSGYRHQLVTSNQTGIFGTFIASQLEFHSSATVDIGGDQDMVELVFDKNVIKTEREDAMKRNRSIYTYFFQLNKSSKAIRESQLHRASERIRFDSEAKAGHVLVMGEFSEPPTGLGTEAFIQDGQLREAWRALNWSPPSYTFANGQVTDLILIGETEAHEMRGAYQFHSQFATHTHLIVDLWAGQGAASDGVIDTAASASFFGGSKDSGLNLLLIVLGTLALLLLLAGILAIIIVGNGRRNQHNRSESNTKPMWPWSRNKNERELESGYDFDEDNMREVDLPDLPSQTTSPVPMAKFESIQLSTNSDIQIQKHLSGSALDPIKEEGMMDEHKTPYMPQIGSFGKPVKTPKPRGGPGRKDDSIEPSSNDEMDEKENESLQPPSELQFTIRKKSKKNSKAR